MLYCFVWNGDYYSLSCNYLNHYSNAMKSDPFLSIISKTIPPPLATQVNGSSAIITGIPVSSWISLFKPVRRAPPPVNTDTNTENLEAPQPEIPEVPSDKDKVKKDPPCPGPKDQRIGDLRNAQGKEKVIGHEIQNGECITLYEATTVVDKYIPTTAQVVNTAQIALVAATMPLLIAAVKPAVAQLIKRIPKLLGRKNKEILSTSQKLARQRSEFQEQRKKNQIGQKKKKKK